MFNGKKKIEESATPQQVMDAIKKRYEAKITYAGDENGKGSGVRIIQPVAYGKSKAGNPVIRAFQPFGDTTTKVPHWKLFRLDRIDKWSGLRNRKFDTPPAPQWGGNAQGAFNPLTDKSMSEVYMIADFEGAKERYNDNLRKHNEKVRAQKREEDPFYDLKRNIKNSIKATPEIMKRIEDWQKEQELRKQRQQQNVSIRQTNNAKEMASIKDFGDNNIVTTSEPVSKQDTVIDRPSNTPQNVPKNQQPNEKDYRKVMNNGPVFKGQETRQEEIPDTEIENNLENDNEKE